MTSDIESQRNKRLLENIERWQLPDSLREEINRLVGDGVTDNSQLLTFLSLLKLDIRMLLFIECDRKQRADGRRRFAASVAETMRNVLSVEPGRGRDGPYYKLIGAAMHAAGVEIKDPYDYVKAGIDATALSDKELLTHLPLATKSERSALVAGNRSLSSVIAAGGQIV